MHFILMLYCLTFFSLPYWSCFFLIQTPSTAVTSAAEVDPILEKKYKENLYTAVSCMCVCARV